MGRKVDKKIWLCVVLGVIGLYLLCMVGGLSLSRGDSMVLLCAFLFSGHILMVDHFFAKNGRRTAELYPVLCHSTAVHHLHLLFESPTVADLQAAALPILYAGILSSGVGYTLQIVAQKGLNPTIASLTMSLESVFSALAGWVLLGQGLSLRELSGCALMFAAIVLAQLPDSLFRRRKADDAAPASP